MGARPASTLDYRAAAQRRLPRVLFDYIDGGSYAEATLRANVSDFEKLLLRQRVLKDVSRIDLASELFGQAVSMPVALAPVGIAGMSARRGEVQAARAAKAAGVPMILSTVAICDIAEVADAAGPIWFQLYMIKDRGYMAELLDEAARAACPVLVFTVDLPVPGVRYRDVRNGMNGGAGARLRTVLDGLTHPAWLWDVQVRGKPLVFGNLKPAIPEARGVADFWGWVAKNFDPSVTWADIAWIRERWKGPIVIKGVLEPEDARFAVEAGADGIVVSNHGGRQLDGALSSIAALPAVVDAVGGETTILMDGGIRSGLDVVKALALGAQGCLIGRPWAWALGARGGEGVAHVLEIVRAEIRTALALSGCTDVKAASRDLLVDRGTDR